MTRNLLTGLLCLCVWSLEAQVVNTEKLRSERKETGWYVDVDFSLSLTRNKAGRNLSLNSSIRTEYLMERQKILAFASYSLGQFRNVFDSTALPSNWLNNRFIHLRYNYDLSPRITLEVFSQAQFDEVQEIRGRLLNGLGPRIQIIENDTASLYFGALYMYEYEETTDTDPLTINRASRLSSYISAGYALNPYFTINHISYYQPNLSDFADFRISSETSLAVKLTRQLSFNTYFQFIYDSRPPETVPEVMYSSRTGLSFTF